MKEPVWPGPASRGDQPLQGSLEPGQGAARGRRVREPWGEAEGTARPDSDPQLQGRCQAHLGGVLEKELLLLEPPDRRPEEVTTTSDSSSTPPAGGPRQQHPRYPVFDPHASQGLQVSGRVSDARSGELCLDGAAPRGLSPVPPPLHPRPAAPPPPCSAPLGPGPSGLPSLLPLLLHPERGRPSRTRQCVGWKEPSLRSPGPELPTASGLSPGGPGGAGAWQPQTLCPGRKRNCRQTHLSLEQALHFLPFKGNLKLPSSKQLRCSGFY